MFEQFIDNLHRRYEPTLARLGHTSRAYAESILGNLDEINDRAKYEAPSPSFIRYDFTLTVPGTREIVPNISRDGTWEFAIIAWESDPGFAAGAPTIRVFTDGDPTQTDYRTNGKLLYTNAARNVTAGQNFPVPLAGSSNLLVTLSGVTDPASPIRGYVLLKHTPAKHPTPVRTGGVWDLAPTRDEPDLGAMQRHTNGDPVANAG